ncbi:MerR family transcriptional regulator [Erysipelothrix urinaevulpis]|uniref:MerR family transcriptional regulator n=1 Tax=Erysipelothrix urinaevulpis TaxID=2683717 RepID=UPI001358696E|nr:MerR family transcriptional regulator [Erysipelothrix urinaevulpis]
MKDEKRYKIGEISKAYGIGVDSLRYYEEIGILHPKREANNYRMYSVEDIRRLNVLKELRSLGFSFEDIKHHLLDFDLNDTHSLFKNEIEIIYQKIKRLETLKDILEQRIDKIEKKKDLQLSDTPIIKDIDKRYIIQFSDNLYHDEEVDFVLKNIQNTDNDLYMIGREETGAIIPLDEIAKKGYGTFSSVFFLSDEDVHNSIIEQGTYVCMAVYGSYDKLPSAWNRLLAYLEDHNLEAIDNPIELYIVDNHSTSKVDEYITELQVKINPLNHK